MATPQVAGAVAFAAMNFPTESVTQRISRILSHTTPVSTLTGKMTTGGRLNLLGCIDTDGDGLADWWEMDHFGNLSQIASGDPDGDGFINSQEFFSGTSPVNSNSHLAFSAFTRGTNATANHFNLTFPSVEDSTYRIDWSDNLNTWSPLGSPITGTGAPVQIVDPNALLSSPKRFYRLSLLPE